jgi:energy-coupling factor transporter ATP-binding protein EcfA2
MDARRGVLLTGPTASGKTSLLRVLGRLDDTPPSPERRIVYFPLKLRNNRRGLFVLLEEAALLGTSLSAMEEEIKRFVTGSSSGAVFLVDGLDKMLFIRDDSGGNSGQTGTYDREGLKARVHNFVDFMSSLSCLTVYSINRQYDDDDDDIVPSSLTRVSVPPLTEDEVVSQIPSLASSARQLIKCSGGYPLLFNCLYHLVALWSGALDHLSILFARSSPDELTKKLGLDDKEQAKQLTEEASRVSRIIAAYLLRALTREDRLAFWVVCALTLKQGIPIDQVNASGPQAEYDGYSIYHLFQAAGQIQRLEHIMEHSLHHLKDQCIIYHQKGGYILSVPLMLEWFQGRGKDVFGDLHIADVFGYNSRRGV